MADLRISWLAVETAAEPIDVKVSWLGFDTAAEPVDVRISWLAFDTDAEVAPPPLEDKPLRMPARRRVKRVEDEEEALLMLLMA
jgi:hypothetical protein